MHGHTICKTEKQGKISEKYYNLWVKVSCPWHGNKQGAKLITLLAFLSNYPIRNTLHCCQWDLVIWICDTPTTSNQQAKHHSQWNTNTVQIQSQAELHLLYTEERVHAYATNHIQLTKIKRETVIVAQVSSQQAPQTLTRCRTDKFKRSQAHCRLIPHHRHDLPLLFYCTSTR